MRIYVAGPLTQGYLTDNVRTAIEVATALLDAGHFPYLPHLSVFWDLVTPQDYETWMALDFEWIAQCEALVRLPGHCPGCEREIQRARELGIPIYHWESVDDRERLLGTRAVENNFIVPLYSPLEAGMMVRFMGATDQQVKWGNNDDPRGILKIGSIYEISEVEVHNWHTKIYLVSSIDDGLKFNSVCFESVE